MNTLSRTLLLALLAGTQAALAQTSSPDAKLAALPDAAASGATSGSGSKVAVEAGEDGAKVKLRATSDPIEIDGSNYFRFTFGAEAPFDADSQHDADLGTLSGLTSGTTATLEVSWLHWPGPSSGDIARVETECARQLATLLPGFSWQDNARPALSLSQFTSRTCQEDLFTEAEIDSIVTKLKGGIQAMNTAASIAAAKAGVSAPAPIAEPDAIDGLKRKAGTARLAVARETNRATKPVRFVTLGASANRNDFRYVLETSPTVPLNADQTGTAFGLSYTEAHGDWLWNLGYSREKTYEAGSQTQICSPIGTTGSLSCGKAVVGAPELQDADLASAEIRWMFSHGKYAISPRIEYDASDSEWGIRLPIYLARNSSNALTAGIALGYTTKEDDLGISLFVGKAFEFFD